MTTKKEQPKPPKFDTKTDYTKFPASPQPIAPANTTFKLISYGTIDKRKMPYDSVEIKVPRWVSKFIDENIDEGSSKTAIYTRIIEIGCKALAEEIKIGNVEIKY